MEDVGFDHALECVDSSNGPALGKDDAFGSNRKVDARPGRESGYRPSSNSKPPRIEHSLASRNLSDRGLAEIDHSHEVGHVASLRCVEYLRRRSELFDHSVVHDRDSITQNQRFLLIMGDEDRRDADAPRELAKLGLHRLSEIAIECGQRLVQEYDVRVEHDGPCEGDPLLLPSG